MIYCKRTHLESRCRQRGYSPEEVIACIVSEDGDQIVVDETHPAYPRDARPGFVQKATNFAAAAARHLANGGRQCTDEQIASRYAICQACPFLVDKRCTKCGCGVSSERGIVSKLSWASESCPVGKWSDVDS